MTSNRSYQFTRPSTCKYHLPEPLTYQCLFGGSISELMVSRKLQRVVKKGKNFQSLSDVMLRTELSFPQIHIWKPQGIWKWGSWEVGRFRWGQEGGGPQNVISDLKERHQET